MYRDLGVHDVVGVDISKVALSIANRDYPAVRTICCRIEDIDFPPQRFDLAISESSLQHVPKHHIHAVVEKLSMCCRLIYVKELTASNDQREEFFMHRYDYPAHFSRCGLSVLEAGAEEPFTWYLFGRSSAESPI